MFTSRVNICPQNHDDLSLNVSIISFYNRCSGINMSKSHTLGNHNYRINLPNMLGEASIFLYGTVFVNGKFDPNFLADIPSKYMVLMVQLTHGAG